MAIAIVSSPDKFSPTYNPVVFSLTTDNYAQPNFKFVADVYNGSGILMTSLKYQAQVVGTDPVIIDISKILFELVDSDYLYLNTTQSPDIVNTAGAGVASYSVQFGEQYSNMVHANLVSYSGYVFNAGLNNLRFPFYASSDYLNKKFLTRFNRQTVRKRDSAMISMLQSDSTAITAFTLTIFNMAGTQLYTTDIANTFTSLSNTAHRLLHLNVGFDYLYGLLSFSSTIYNSAAYYNINTTSGAIFRFDLYSRCERFPGMRLHFLNELGGWDSFNFMLDNKPKQTTERKSYQRQAINVRTGYDAASKKFEAIVRNFDTKYSEHITASSDYLYDIESELLADLLSASLVYQEADATKYGGTGTILIPVNITTLEYEIKKTRVDKLFTLDIDLELTTENRKQVI